MRPFAYSAPATLHDAVALIGRSARPLAGGTDLIALMKAGLVAPERLVSVRGLLPQDISEGGDGLTIGAGATLAGIARDGRIAGAFAALAQAAAIAASPQLRNMATLGGNLLQRPRCWYFRSPHLRCWLKGGDRCYARDGESRQHALFGGGPCMAVHPSDPAAALLAFDADVLVRGSRGERRLRLEALFELPQEGRRRETTLAEDELLLAVRLPPHPDRTRSVYLKAMDRQAFAFALAGVAAAVRLSPAGKIGHARLVLSGVAPIPWRARAAEAVLAGANADDGVLREAARAALEGAELLRQNGWKVPLARALVHRALKAVTSD